MLAVCGASLVTLVTVAGGLGVGPGAAMASMTPESRSSSARPPSSASAESSTPHRSSANGGSGSWLTIERHPSHASRRSHDAGAPSTERPDQGSSADSTSPPAPASSGDGKRVVFDQSDQRVWLVDADGAVVRTYRVSGSVHDNLQPGTYQVYSRSRDAVSFDGRETMGYMVRFTQGKHAPIGFHDIPRRHDGSLVETRDQLGTPMSAGCIRQWPADAMALWRFAPVGTAVVVVA